MAAKSAEKDKGEGQEPAATLENENPPDSSEPAGQKAAEMETTTPTKRDGGRKRKRHLFNSIRSQMEFYFGDANLSKDRFLRRYVDQDPYVPLEVFLTFNKIKTLTQDAQQIAKSLSNSQLLELDESGLKVKRKTKLPKQRDVNDKTLYVEALPANATHDWLKEVFSRYGPVAYVSLPHYPGTKRIKEFAFIEFEKAGAVEKAVKAFEQIHGVLSVETDPGELASVRSFQQQQQQQQENQQQQEELTEPEEPPKISLKREIPDKSGEGLEAKRVKLENEQPSGVSTAEETASETDAEATVEASEQDGKPEATDTKKRRRKRKKKVIMDKPNIEPSALELKVLPKTSWSSLRNKYLNLQRRLVSEAKSKQWRENHPQNQQQHHHHHNHQAHNHPNPPQPKPEAVKEEENSAEALSDGGGEPGGGAGGDGVPVPVKRRKAVHKMNMNFYGAGGVDSTKSEEPSQERTPLFKYEPGLIVECTLLEPCTNVKEFKADMRQYPDIKYVDIKESDQVALLRLATPLAAEELVRQVSCAERQLKVLRGQPETLYWRKIEQDREAKLSKKVRVQQKRGREKISKMLAKHIKFDDGDDEVPGGAID
ncbi:la-related protein 7 [Drosophila kikkawai]|uniref:La-related protein 7 n=1 Tax=Drosophila kikkawai TaxID=30033 RepID=A0A6P4J3J2_DROKI|nr:la-related protein 7 [Drosophila kikkawai]KAH8327444.1 hypothetical protein KR059_001770 [Drosophila kikkawai]